MVYLYQALCSIWAAPRTVGFTSPTDPGRIPKSLFRDREVLREVCRERCVLKSFDLPDLTPKSPYFQIH